MFCDRSQRALALRSRSMQSSCITTVRKMLCTNNKIMLIPMQLLREIYEAAFQEDICVYFSYSTCREFSRLIFLAIQITCHCEPATPRVFQLHFKSRRTHAISGRDLRWRADIRSLHFKGRQHDFSSLTFTGPKVTFSWTNFNRFSYVK